MKVSDLLASRRESWRELELLCSRLEGRDRPHGEIIARFSSLYRAACADLALADAYQLPPATIEYLHGVVGRAHNQLYRSRRFRFDTWARRLLVDVPRQLYRDGALRLAFFVFWGMFLLSLWLAYTVPNFAQQLLDEDTVHQLNEHFSTAPRSHGTPVHGGMAGFYIFNNIGIGLRCFAFGLAFGVGGLFITLFNASFLGAVFGYMVSTPQRPNFLEFITAHGPFELTAIVFSAAAGMRLGFSLVDTGGWTRSASLRRAGQETMPTMGAAMILFALAALIEAFLSPSAAPYGVKAAVAVVSAAILTFYVLVLGRPRRG